MSGIESAFTEASVYIKDDYRFYFFELQEDLAITHSQELNPGTFYWSWRSAGSLNLCAETCGKVHSWGMGGPINSKFSKGAVTQKRTIVCHREETEAYLSFGTLHNQFEAPI